MQDEVFLYVYRYINIDIFCYNVLWVKKKEEENIKGILYGFNILYKYQIICV